MRKNILLTSSFLFSGLLVGLYIFQLNSLSTLAWRAAEVEDQLMQLKYQQAALQQKAYQAISLSDLEELAREREFVKINSITYLKARSGLVAQNQ